MIRDHEYCSYCNEPKECKPAPTLSNVTGPVTESPANPKKINKISKTRRPQESFKTNNKFIELNEEKFNSDTQYQNKKIGLLQKDILNKQIYLVKHASCLERQTSAAEKQASDLESIATSGFRMGVKIRGLVGAHVKGYSSKIATSNLLRHLKDDHGIEDPQKTAKATTIQQFFTQRIPSKSAGGRTEVTPQKRKWLLARDLALWFARSLIPFDTVNDEAMIDFLKKYNVIVSETDLPSRQNIAREGLEDVYSGMLSYVKNYIAKHNSRFGALTTDMWTDQYRRRSYITCTYHFISDEMQLCKFTLATKQVIKNHTAETIKDEIQEVMLSFQIEGKDIHLVTDSGSNMKRAANLLEMSNHLCLGHALHNLITVDGIQKTREVFDLITKCRKIVKHLRYRAPQLEFSANDEQRDLLLSINEIGDHLEESDEEITLSEQQTPIASVSAPPTIKTATPTRWHSVLMMLSSINHKANRRPINLLLQKIGQSTLLLRDNEHNMIEQLISLFQKFKEIVDIMSSESQPTINLVLIFRSEIKRLLEDVEDNENLVLKNLLSNMLEKLDHRFPISEIEIASALLDCRFQAIKEIDHYMEQHNTTKVSFLSSFIQRKLSNLDVNSPYEPSESEQQSTSSSFLMTLSRRHTNARQEDNNAIETECWRYLTTANAQDLEQYGENILQYWKDRETIFPWLYNLAKAILFIPATSTPSERVFSVAGQLLTAKRSQIDELVDSLRNITLESSRLNQENMATQVNGEVQPITLQMLKMFVDTVPSFNAAPFKNEPPMDFGKRLQVLRSSLAQKLTLSEPSSVIRTAMLKQYEEFQCHDDITFILFDFHSFFDGILGLKQLLKLGLNIDLQNKFLISKCLKIPIDFREPDIEPYQITIHAHEVAALSIPMSLDNGDVIIPESEINGLYLPETLTTARDGFATTEVYNYSDSTVTVEFRQPLNSADEDINITLDELLDIEEIFDPKTDRNPDKINILSDIQIAPAPVQETDEMTVHTAVENPVLEIPFTENTWQDMKKQIKKKKAQFDSLTNTTGGGPPPNTLSNSDERLLSLLDKTAVDGDDNIIETEVIFDDSDIFTMPVECGDENVQVVSVTENPALQFHNYLESTEDVQNNQKENKPKFSKRRKSSSSQVRSKI
nr:unnamed protein product [Callosobruchus analis]